MLPIATACNPPILAVVVVNAYIDVLPETTKFLPRLKLPPVNISPPIPAPPATTNAPFDEFNEFALPNTVTFPLGYISIAGAAILEFNGVVLNVIPEA